MLSNYVCFHIPLHRQLAFVTIKNFMTNKIVDLPDDTDFLKALIAHPLRIQVKLIFNYMNGV